MEMSKVLTLRNNAYNVHYLENEICNTSCSNSWVAYDCFVIVTAWRSEVCSPCVGGGGDDRRHVHTRPKRVCNDELNHGTWKIRLYAQGKRL